MRRVVTALVIAALALAIARLSREAAASRAIDAAGDAPFAPSPRTARLVSLGYHELAADLLFVRLTGYFGGDDSTATGVADLADAIAALDPQFHRVYEYGARAMTLAKHGVDQSTYQRAIALLEDGSRVFPDDYLLPYLAGQIYTQDLKTDDPAQRRVWDEKGTLLVESAIRKPGAPLGAQIWASMMRTKLGEHQRAVDGLKEMLLVTSDPNARRRMLEQLAKLENEDAAAIAGEVFEAKQAFERAWKRDRPGLPPAMYILLGPRPAPGFDMGDLATGGRDLVTSAPVEKLEPVE